MGICMDCGAVIPNNKANHKCKGEPKEETLSLKEIQEKIKIIENARF